MLISLVLVVIVRQRNDSVVKSRLRTVSSFARVWLQLPSHTLSVKKILSEVLLFFVFWGDFKVL